MRGEKKCLLGFFDHAPFLSVPSQCWIEWWRIDNRWSAVLELSYYWDAVPPGTRVVFWAARFGSKSLRAGGRGWIFASVIASRSVSSHSASTQLVFMTWRCKGTWFFRQEHAHMVHHFVLIRFSKSLIFSRLAVCKKLTIKTICHCISLLQISSFHNIKRDYLFKYNWWYHHVYVVDWCILKNMVQNFGCKTNITSL